MDAYGPVASEFSSALAGSPLSVPFLAQHHLAPQLASLPRSSSSSTATIRTNLAESGCAFGIIAAFIAYYVGPKQSLYS
ncbi:hypothetical protein ARMGADRAFT_1093289 [Armillaria gallica]|uniref:Uncharacterized protein n=1 Tax=Armillaria gallica TaxID=47427 RepID=A0A2H3C889_ARMGA|nr:hypothetical protein ARMGADRAFT_1093289 [Armillaria gallica]